MTKLVEVSQGDVLVDQENEEEYTVTALHPESGCAVLRDSEERELAVSIKNLLDAIKDGDMAVQEKGEDEEEE